MSASPLSPVSLPVVDLPAEYSSALTVVVPTATIRRPVSIARLMAAAASAEIE